MFSQFSKTDRALLWATLKFEGEKASSLLSLLPESQVNSLQSPLKEFLTKSKKEQDQILAQELYPWNQEGEISLLQEADATWIMNAFSEESLSVLSLLFQQLPKAKVGSILKDLSKDTRKTLKKIKLKECSPFILTHLQSQWESVFPKIKPQALKQGEFLKKLRGLSFDGIQGLLYELGISELALAFNRLSRSAVRAILNRLPNKDAKEIQKRIKLGISASLKEQKEAQKNLLEMDFDKVKPNDMVQGIGFMLFAQAFGEHSSEATTYFIYKFPRQQGLLFKQYVESHQGKISDEQRKQIRGRILRAYVKVAED